MSRPDVLSHAANAAAPGVSEVAIGAQTIKEAARWLMRLQVGEMSERDWSDLQRWRTQSPEHARAWQRAETLTRKFATIPASVGMPALDRPDAMNRRSAIKILTVIAVAAPAGWLAWRQAPWREWIADYRTATGERHEVVLADGSHLTLNTATAVDVKFNEAHRLVTLHEGEILVQVNPDPDASARPFLVQTVHGTARARDTRFMVRRFADGTRVAVTAGTLEIRSRQTGAAAVTLLAGQEATVTPGGAGAPTVLDAHAEAWTQGILYARDQRLGDFLAELSRYRRGVLRCDPAVAELRLSGVFRLADTNRILAMLQSTLPVRVSTWASFWTSVGPA